MPELVHGGAGEVVADKASDHEASYARLAARGMASGLIRRRPRPPRQDRPRMGRKFAGAKNRHGLTRLRDLSLARVSLQGIMVAVIINLKRLGKLLLDCASPLGRTGPLRGGEVHQKEAEEPEKMSQKGPQGAVFSRSRPRKGSMLDPGGILAMLILAVPQWGLPWPSKSEERD